MKEEPEEAYSSGEEEKDYIKRLVLIVDSSLDR